MPYLMTDVAAGGQAARTMQQNMFGGQYDEQTAALANQENQLKIQQEQANVEKTRLSNLVADSGFKASEDSKAKLQAITKTPEWAAADDVKRLQMAAAIQMQSGDIEGGAKTATAAELFATRKTANEVKQLDKQHELVGNAYSVIEGIPDDQVTSFVDRLPKENKDALISQVGQENWDKMDGKQKKEAAKNLMLNAKGQLVQRKIEADAAKTKAIDDTRIKVAEIQATWHSRTKLAGVAGTSKEDMAALRIYQQSSQRDEVVYKDRRKTLDKSVDDAKTEVDKGRLFGVFGASDTTTKRYNKAVEDRNTFEREQLQRDSSTASLLPAGGTKGRIMEELKKRAALLDPEGDKEKESPRTASGKVDPPTTKVPSNKGGSELQAKVEASGQKYEPTKYDYRVAPDGSIQRKAK